MKKILMIVCAAFAVHAAKAQQACWQTKAGAGMADAIAPASAVAEMNRYDVHFYKLDLALRNYDRSISGSVTTYARAELPVTTIVLELHDTLSVDSVWTNGVLSTFSRQPNLLRIDAPGTIQPDSMFSVRVFYHGYAPLAGQAAIGKGYTSDPFRQVAWSLSEPFSAHEWWPCKQVLTDKADSSEVWITTDSSNKAGSNGLLINTTQLPNGKVRYEWKSRYPIAYYLISVAVGPYQEYNSWAHPQGSDSILVQNYLYKSASMAIKTGADYSAPLIEIFSDLYGLYPFAAEKYGHCQVPIGGGMEHQTMTTMGVFSFDVVAHELAHQWFGDQVTCASWADIWLNEGFASYNEFVAIQKMNRGTDRAWLNTAMFYALRGWGSIYVNDTENVGRIFDYNLTYRKGALLLHMMRHELNNDSLFFGGIRQYLAQHAYGTAYGSDFRNAMTQFTGHDFTTFFDQWYYGRGWPVFTARWNRNTAAGHVVVKLTHFGADAATQSFRTALDIRLYHNDTFSDVRVQVDSTTEYYTIPVSFYVDSIGIDEDEWVLNEDTVIYDATVAGVGSYGKSGKQVLVYPNPAHDAITVRHAQGCQATLMDMTGREVMSFPVGSDDQTQSFPHVSPGVYMLRLNHASGTESLRIVKQ